MMFFSRLLLKHKDQQSDAFWNLDANPYGMHQETWRLFGGGPDAQRDFLYRVESEDPRGPVMYGLSPRQVVDTEGLWETESKPYSPKLTVGGELAFSVRVNPVRQRDGKRHDVVMDAKHSRRGTGHSAGELIPELVQTESESWMRSRGEANGFELVGLRAYGYQSRRFRQGRKNRGIKISTCDLEGVLRVNDPELFLQLVFRGLGPAKAFGCGLFLLRRL